MLNICSVLKMILNIYEHRLQPSIQITSAKSLAESPAMYAGDSPFRSIPRDEAMCTARCWRYSLTCG